MNNTSNNKQSVSKDVTPNDESYRLMARRVILAARRGDLPRPRLSPKDAILVKPPNSSSLDSEAKSSFATATSRSTSSENTDNISFKTAQENSIEVYDDDNGHFERNSILTRSARVRKFKFYQYKPIKDSSPSTTSTAITGIESTPKTTANRWAGSNGNAVGEIASARGERSPSSPETPILLPRDDVLKGKIPLVSEQSKELVELDNQILELEKRITDLTRGTSSGNGKGKQSSDSPNQLEIIFELVNQKNDLLRRQMQLNILEQEKALEKANEELTKELRSLLSIDDSRKTKAQLERQKYLYDQSLALVNKRNELVHHMDVQERAIDDDIMLKETVRARRDRLANPDQNCCIQ